MNKNSSEIALIIPARNEELSLPGVLRNVPPIITRVVVVDNGSTDGTARIATAYGAEVVYEEIPGYGRACLAGLSALRDFPPEIVAFVDADGSDELACLPVLIASIKTEEQDFVLGERVPVERSSLSFQQQFGHVLATGLIRLFWSHRYHDLGPMRAIRWAALERLKMADLNFGWTVEMQIRALKHGLRILEIRVPYHKRSTGKSKISRTISGSFKAGRTILWTICRELASELRERKRRTVALDAGITAKFTP